MPSRSLIHGGEKQAKNFKKAKDRVTLQGYCMEYVHQGAMNVLWQFCVHKSARPHCFKNAEISSLPVCYLS